MLLRMVLGLVFGRERGAVDECEIVVLMIVVQMISAYPVRIVFRSCIFHRGQPSHLVPYGGHCRRFLRLQLVVILLVLCFVRHWGCHQISPSVLVNFSVLLVDELHAHPCGYRVPRLGQADQKLGFSRLDRIFTPLP